ncbi:hypothetical protein G4228_012379 [Cervus hanglu yarkandensis]|nr:hypothetical protein G4228_012379 [Cervus hanglu yarkandensis]
MLTGRLWVPLLLALGVGSGSGGGDSGRRRLLAAKGILHQIGAYQPPTKKL